MLISSPPDVEPAEKQPASSGRRFTVSVSGLPVELLLALVTLAVWWVGYGYPALEDDKFWWIPQGLIEAERGPTLFPDGELPAGLLPAGAPLPPQWTGGIPDYAHPPLFFAYLGAWYRILGPGMRTTHLALLPLALLLMMGMVRLIRRVAGPDGVVAATVCLLCSPPIVAQLARADLDLPLLAVTPWALEALLARRRLRFALLAAIATWVKEPGVLLTVPALVCVVTGPVRARRGALLAALAPVAALGAWALIHRARAGWGLAEPERIAPDLLARLHDLAAVSRFVLLEQGRVVLSGAILAALTLSAGRRWWPAASGLASGIASGTASGPASRPGFGPASGDVAGAAPGTASGGVAGAAPGTASGDVAGAAPGTASGGVAGAAPADLAGAVSGAVCGPAEGPGGLLRAVASASSILPTPARGYPLNSATWVIGAHTSIHLLFFGTINFLGGDPYRTAGSHLRYLLPALPSLVTMAAMAVPVLFARPRWRLTLWGLAMIPALLDWHGPPVGGVERNLSALDVARANLALAPRLVQAVNAGQSVWVGSYAYLDFSSPAVGLAQPVKGLQAYGQSTDPATVPDGALVLESAHGEPLGRLSQMLELKPLFRATVHNGWAQLYEVVGRKQ